MAKRSRFSGLHFELEQVFDIVTMDMQYLKTYDQVMTLSKKYTCFFAFGVGCIALGYSLWMYAQVKEAHMTLVMFSPVIFGPLSAFTVAAGCWHFIVEKKRRYGWFAGVFIGVVSGWSLFAAGLLIHFVMLMVMSGTGIQAANDLSSIMLAVFVVGPFLLFILWGWIPVLMCVLLGVLLLRFRCAQFPKKPEE